MGPMVLLVDYSKNRAGVDVPVPPKRSSAPLFGMAPREVTRRKRATHHGGRRRSMSSWIEETEDGHEEEPHIRIKFRLKRRGSTGTNMREMYEVEASAAKLHQSVRELFFHDDDVEGGERKSEVDEDKGGDGKGMQDDHSVTSSTRSMDDFYSSMHTGAGQVQGDCFVDTRKFIKGLQQKIVSTTIASGGAGDDPVRKEESGFVGTSMFSRGHQDEKGLSQSTVTNSAPGDKLLAPSPSNLTSGRTSPIQINGDALGATPDHTRRALRGLPSLKRSNKKQDNSGGISCTQNRLATSSSLKNLETDAADFRRSNFRRNSSMKAAKTGMSGLELERQDSLRMMKVHSLRNIMGDVSNSWHDSVSINVPSDTSRRRAATKSFSTMNFTEDIQGAHQLDRRAGLKKNKTVSSMRNLARTVMDDTSSRDHYYRGCSLRNLMSDSTRTLTTLLKDVSERNQSDSKRTRTASVARFNMMRQNSGRNDSFRNIKHGCSERSLNVDRMNVMRQKSGHNLLKDRSICLRKDLTEKTLGQDSSRRTCRRDLVRQESNKSIAQDQSMSNSNTRRNNRKLVTRSGSFRNLMDIGENLMDIGENYVSTRGPNGATTVTENHSRRSKQGFRRCESDLTSFKTPASKERSDPTEKDTSRKEANRRLGLLLGQTISYRSSSKRNLCRVSSGRSHSGSPVPKFIAASPRA
jgi:hypothetical protein